MQWYTSFITPTLILKMENSRTEAKIALGFLVHKLFFFAYHNSEDTSIRSPPRLEKKPFFSFQNHFIAKDMKGRPYPFFDHSSIVTRVTLPWKKRQIIWLTMTQEWCFRTHPMGPWGAFISKGGCSWTFNWLHAPWAETVFFFFLSWWLELILQCSCKKKKSFC